jgi:hypothetical protein
MPFSLGARSLGSRLLAEAIDSVLRMLGGTASGPEQASL